MIGRMKEALDELHMTAEPEALQLVARAAEGAMRDAFSILDMCVAGAENGTITAAQVRDALGTSDRAFLFEFMDCIADRDAAGVLRKVDELMRSGREPQVFLKDLSSHCRMLMTVQAVKENAAALLDVTNEDEQRLREQAERFSFQRLLRVLDGFLHAEGELRFASTPRIGLESAALHACEAQRSEDVSALVERISELEAQLTALQSDIASGKLALRAEGGDTPKKARRPLRRREKRARPKPPEPAPKPHRGQRRRAGGLEADFDPDRQKQSAAAGPDPQRKIHRREGRRVSHLSAPVQEGHLLRKAEPAQLEKADRGLPAAGLRQGLPFRGRAGKDRRGAGGRPSNAG